MINIFVILLTLLLSLNTIAANWKRLNTTTIEVSGNFIENEIQNLRPIWHDEINSIIVLESISNDLDLSVGNFLKTKKYNLTLKGLCSIGCVENLVLPAEIIKLESGCIRVSENAQHALNFEKKSIYSLDKHKLSNKENELFLKSLNTWKNYQDEQFKSKNIKPTFYADHELVKKGLIYFPSANRLLSSGLKIQGEISLECIIRSNSKSFYFN
jgi:hypothetical protein